MKKFAKLRARLRSLLLILVLATAQVATATGPFISRQTASAANEISVLDHEGQLKPAGTYTNGNVTTYTELDKMNFRFDIDSSSAATGKMQVEFTSNDTGCLFFDGAFALGTHTGGATLTDVTGTAPVITLDGPAVNDGDDWIQVLNVSFAATGSATVNYYLTLSDEAGECSSGSPQHSRLANAPNGGAFKNIGQQNVPIPSSQIIELPEIFVEKWVDSNADGVVDRRATAGEWYFKLDNGTPVATDANGKVTFTNVTPNGNHTVVELNGPAGQSFLSGSGTNCTFVGSTATANVTSGETSTDATCIFNNGVQAGKIIVEKQTLPDGNAQSFNFTSSYDNDGFSLSDGQTNTSGNLSAGTYSVGETVPAGWDLSSATCSDGSPINAISLAAGETVTCTFTNTKRGHLIVQKTTYPAGDPTQFSINATGSGTITGSSAGTISDATDKDYEVTPGTYSVSETVPGGWAKTGDTCQGVVVAPGATVTCLITNTKYGTLVIIKNALPNDPQDFAFSTTNLGGALFNLDDDADATLSNTQTFSNLLPGAYSVTESTTPHWSMTGLSCDTANYQTVGGTVSVSLAAGQTTTCTYENTKLGSISGTKFIVNADGSLTANQTAALGWTVNLILGGNVVQTTQTDANGDYSFSDLLIGLPYSVAEVLTAGWTQITTPGTCTNDSPITLAAGQNSTDNDFCNFQNGSIGGYKWNDKNGNGTKQEDEPKLAGWTITLYNANNQPVGSPVVTDVNGSYSFTNLAPGSYSVCESPQANWVQTFPANNGCHYITIDQSGESNTANFGNQGRGNITVIKNVDTDGDGDVDTAGVTNWTWDITDGAQNTATGSSQNVAAGTYTVSEDQKDNFHVVSVVCDEQVDAVNESAVIVVTPGANVTCTFTNARDTATITVNKVVNPTNDTGKFNLQIDGQTAGTGANVGHNGTTGTVVVPTGTHTVSETAGVNTSLANYASTYSCTNQVAGNGTSTGSFSLVKGQNVTCTFTNTRYAKIIVIKQTLPDGSSKSFNFNASYDQDGFSLSDGQSNDSSNLLPGNYSVSENVPAGWDLTNSNCSDESATTQISLQAGETVTCTFTNTQRGSISGTKYEADASDTQGTAGEELSNWTIRLYNDGADEDTLLDDLVTTKITNGSGDYSFANLLPGNYRVCEALKAGWTQIFPVSNEGCYLITLAPGQTSVDNDFGNFKNGSISGYKFHDVNGNGTKDGILEPKIGNWRIYLFKDDVQIDTTLTSSSLLNYGNFSFTNLAPGNYTVCEEKPAGWVQITPDPTVNEGCYDVTINQSGESNTAIFGNQARATITVIKNVDQNGDGDVEDEGETNSSEWTWDYFSLLDSDTEVTTGQTKSVRTGVLGTFYFLNENQQEGYDLVDIDCNEGFLRIGDSVKVFATVGDEIECTFTNKKRAEVVIHKDAYPADGTDFTFTLSNTDPNENEVDLYSHNFNNNDWYHADKTFVLDDAAEDDLDAYTDSETLSLKTDKTYYITEDTLDGWDLDDIACYIGESQLEIARTNNTLELYIQDASDAIHCYFVNEKRGEVVVTKYNDLNRNGEQDEDEATLSGWDITLTDSGDYDETQTTGDEGTTTFENVKPNEYYLSEQLQDGWHFSDLDCDYKEWQEAPRREVNLVDEVIVDDEENQNPGGWVYVSPGETLNCAIGNYHDVVLSLTKANNRPNATVVGDTVTYTLTASLDEQSGALFGTSVTDLPPEGFTYVPGSWTATSNMRGDLKAVNITTEPTYGSPGTWFLGDMLPGEIVTLTYRALIASSVSDGVYPDVAFAQGCALPSAGCDDEEVVLSNLHAADDPFVATLVTVRSPQVLGATILVNTGSSINIAYAVTALSLMLIGAITMKRREFQKGGAQ